MSFLRKQITVENEKSQYNVLPFSMGSFLDEEKNASHFIFNLDRLVIHEKKVDSFHKLLRCF